MSPDQIGLISLREEVSRTHHIEREDDMKDIGRRWLQGRVRSLRRNQTCQHLDLGLPGSRTVRK